MKYRPVEPDGWFDFRDLYARVVQEVRPHGHLVELGAFKGLSTVALCQLIEASQKPLILDVWDNWVGVPAAYSTPIPPERLEQTVRQAIQPYPFAYLHTGDCILAADHYRDGTLDFVFLDDDHTAPHVEQECRAWWPKLRPGGLLAGHDWDWESVRAGVQAWAQEAGVTPEKTSQRCWQVRKA